MELKTKYLAHLLFFLSIVIDISVKYVFTIEPDIKIILHNIHSIGFLIAVGLFIWRGIYYIRKNGYKHTYLVELLLGLFLAIGLIFMLYTTKMSILNSIKPQIPKTMLGKHIKLNKIIARNEFLANGEILTYNGITYNPTETEKELRNTVLEMYKNIKSITQGIYNWLLLIFVSSILGLLLPIRKKINSSA